MCKFQDTNFANIAQELGCFGIRVEDPEEISEALKKALVSDLPAVVDVVTDVACKAPSPWMPPFK
jgi:thiamine pyrophosphate-dependent acetolactate synthase large subunit-like protein